MPLQAFGVQALRRRLPTLEQLPCQSLADRQRLLAAACACLGAGLGTKTPHAGVAALLQQQAHEPSGLLAALFANATGTFSCVHLISSCVFVPGNAVALNNHPGTRQRIGSLHSMLASSINPEASFQQRHACCMSRSMGRVVALMAPLDFTRKYLCVRACRAARSSG